MGQPQGALWFLQAAACSLACSSDLITHVDLCIFDEDSSSITIRLASALRGHTPLLSPSASPLLTLRLYDPVISGLLH